MDPIRIRLILAQLQEAGKEIEQAGRTGHLDADQLIAWGIRVQALTTRTGTAIDNAAQTMPAPPPVTQRLQLPLQ